MQPSKEKDKKKDKTNHTKSLDIEVTIHRKIQLWTNEQENEFALRLAISPTDDNNLTRKILFLQQQIPILDTFHPVAESDYLEDLKHGWDYTLRHFIEEYKQTLKQQQNIQKE